MPARVFLGGSLCGRRIFLSPFPALSTDTLYVGPTATARTAVFLDPCVDLSGWGLYKTAFSKGLKDVVLGTNICRMI